MTPLQLVQLCMRIYDGTGWSRALSEDIESNQRRRSASALFFSNVFTGVI